MSQWHHRVVHPAYHPPPYTSLLIRDSNNTRGLSTGFVPAEKNNQQNKQNPQTIPVFHTVMDSNCFTKHSGCLHLQRGSAARGGATV